MKFLILNRELQGGVRSGRRDPVRRVPAILIVSTLGMAAQRAYGQFALPWQ